jgi:hypothetical protein
MTATTKSDPKVVLDGYLEAWNADDPGERASLLEATVTDDVEFVDPTAHITGRADLLQHIAATRATYQGLQFAPAGEPDAHNNFVRVAWEARIGGRVVLRGIDVDELADDGRLSRIVGFFDRASE